MGRKRELLTKWNQLYHLKMGEDYNNNQSIGITTIKKHYIQWINSIIEKWGRITIMLT